MTPSKPPTRAELFVIAVGASALLILVGVLGFAVIYFAPSQKHEIVVAVKQSSAWSIGIGTFIGFAYWFVRRITN